jgi:hypothetical protein
MTVEERDLVANAVQKTDVLILNAPADIATLQGYLA